jgi:cardiolipin synthase
VSDEPVCAPDQDARRASGGTASGAELGKERSTTRAGKVARRAALEVRAALRPFTIPNGITLLRLGVTPLFVLAVVGGDFKAALALFIAAGISDGLDGLLARTLGERSLLGSYLDPIADKVLLVGAYVALTAPHAGVRIPLWLTVMALSRDLLIVLVALLLYLGAGIREFYPSLLGKATTVMHIVTIGLVLIANIWHVPDIPLLICFYLALALTVMSGVDYIRRVAAHVERMHDRQQPQHGESTWTSGPGLEDGDR